MSSWKRSIGTSLFIVTGAVFVRAEEYGQDWLVFAWFAALLVSFLGHWLLDLWESDVRRDERARFEAELKRARLRD